MSEDVKVPLEGEAGGQAQAQDTGKQKSAEEVIAELKAEKDRLEKQVKDKDAFIGRQSSELGELRRIKEDIGKKPPETKEEKNALVETVKKRLIARGYDEQSAKDNAEILVEEGSTIVDIRLKERAKEEVIDRIQDGFERGEIDEKVWNENISEIMAEVDKRKIPATPNAYYRMVREIYKDVVKKKADGMRETEKQKMEENRDGKIADTSIPPKTKEDKQAEDEEKKARDAIKGAGAPKDSVFF